MQLPKAAALATKERAMKHLVWAVTLQIWIVQVLKAGSLTPTEGEEMTTNLVGGTEDSKALTNLEVMVISNPVEEEIELVSRGEAVEDTSLEITEVGVIMKVEGVVSAFITQTTTDEDSMNTGTKEAAALANQESSRDPTMNLLLSLLSRVVLEEEEETYELG